MRFRIGPWRYSVRIVEGQADGVCSWAPRELRIGATIPPRQRIEVLARLLREAWYYHFGAPPTLEADCVAVASFTVDFMRQLLSQGGEPGLRRLTAGNAPIASIGTNSDKKGAA